MDGAGPSTRETGFAGVLRYTRLTGKEDVLGSKISPEVVGNMVKDREHKAPKCTPFGLDSSNPQRTLQSLNHSPSHHCLPEHGVSLCKDDTRNRLLEMYV